MNNEKGLDFNLVSPEIETIPPKLPDLKTRALALAKEASEIKIENTEDRIAVEEMLRRLKKYMAEYKDILSPGIEAIKVSLKIQKGKRDEIIDPLKFAYDHLRQIHGQYSLKERQERERLQAIEDKKIADLRKKEKDAMAKVLELEKKGDIEKADEVLKEQAEIEAKAMIAQPVERPPEKTKGMSSRMIPKWVVTDPSKLPEAYRIIVPIKPKITGLIRAHGPKEAMRLCPGIDAWEEPSTSVRG